MNYKSSKSTFLHHSNYILQTCTFHPAITNRKRLNYMQNIYNHNKSSNTIITADVNTHSPLWYLQTKDHKGELIKDILLNSNHFTLNTNTPTRLLPIKNNSLLHQTLPLLQQTCMTALLGRLSTPSH